MEKVMGLMVITLAMALSHSIAFAQVKQPHIVDFTGLKLELYTDKQTITQGEKLNVTFVFSNTNNKPLRLRKEMLNPHSGFLQLLIAGADGKYKEYRGQHTQPTYCSEHSESTYYVMKSGERVISDLEVHYNIPLDKLEGITTAYPFPQPGKYLLKGFGSYFQSTNGEKLVSEPIILMVKQLEGDDGKVWDIIQSDGRYVSLLYGASAGGFWEETVLLTKNFEKILQKYPNTTFTPLIKNAIANFYQAEVRLRYFNRKKVEETLSQAGKFLLDGKQEYVFGFLKTNTGRHFLETGLFPEEPELPIEAYIGLAWMMVKDYEKAKQYLNGVTTGLKPAPETMLILEATAFVHLATGDQEQASQLLTLTRKQQASSMLSQFRETIKQAKVFNLEPYEEFASTGSLTAKEWKEHQEGVEKMWKTMPKFATERPIYPIE